MKNELKLSIIALFVSLQNDAKKLYHALVDKLLSLPQATPSQKRYYNASTYSPAILSSLEYDIKKMCGITDGNISRAKKEGVVPQLKVVSDFPEDLKASLDAIDLDTANYNTEIKPLANQLSEVIGKSPASQKKADLVAFINENYTKPTSINDIKVNLQVVFDNAPDAVKTDLKLRDEFPFLADADCPDEFKILIADKLTAYHNYKDGHAEIKQALQAGVSEEELFDLAKTTVDNFELNLQIYDELNYYKEHGSILGKHEIFADKMLEEKVNTMSTIELTKRQKNLRTYVSREETSLRKLKDETKREGFEIKIKEFKDELALVDARLEKIS